MTEPTASGGSGEVCRLAICGPATRVELAVPTHVPLADLLPTLLEHLGPELASTGLDHGGWVLQRLGEPPLAEDLGTAALGLYDGDVVHLRPRNDQLPPVDFDDLVDGVATGVNARPGRWRPESTRWLLLALVGALLAAGIAVAPATGTGGRPSIVAGSAALVLLVGAAAVSRALGDRAAALLLAAGSVGFAAVAGLVLPAAARSSGLLPFGLPGLLTGPGLLAAGAGAAATAVLARVAVGAGSAGFLATATSAALVGGGGLAGVLWLDRAGSAAVTLATALVLALLVPTLAARLAGLQVPPLPTSAEEFQQDLDPLPGRRLLAKAAVADSNMAALYSGLGLVWSGCLAVLGWTAGWAGPTLTAVASALLLLHGRELVGVLQRLATVLPGLIGVASVLSARVAAATLEQRVDVVAALVVLAAVVLGGARALPGRRLLPYWGRLADVLHSLAAVAVVPLVVAVLGLYARARAGWA